MYETTEGISITGTEMLILERLDYLVYALQQLLAEEAEDETVPE